MSTAISRPGSTPTQPLALLAALGPATGNPTTDLPASDRPRHPRKPGRWQDHPQCGLQQILHHLNLRAISLSLDDLYKTYADRQQLQRQDPRLIWRGPPGTHDIGLGIDVLDRLRETTSSQGPIAVPRFDKSLWAGAGDRSDPEWVSAVDVVIFEGWFVGATPIETYLPVDPPLASPFDISKSFDTCIGLRKFPETPEAQQWCEADWAFARDCNERLATYIPLWQRCDRLAVLVLSDYRLSKQWRLQAEQRMRASQSTGDSQAEGQEGQQAEGQQAGQRSAMTDGEVTKFVDYFWTALHPELFIRPMVMPALAAMRRRSFPELAPVSLVLEILADHSLGQITATVPNAQPLS
jgi:D-glycerate 3-kinase